MELILGLITGVLFGVGLQQGRVLRFEKQIGAMLFKEMTIVKFMLSAIMVGMIGIHLCAAAGLAAFSVKATNLGANIIGGLLFGAGWAAMGFCPGTAGGALGEGRWHALWGILGMLTGAALYAEAYPALKASVLQWGKLGKLTLSEVFGVSPWIVIPGSIIFFLLIFVWMEKKEL